MQDIVRRPWFARMWTLQELVMANEPLVVCGSKALGWHDLDWGIGRWVGMPENRSHRGVIDTFILTRTANFFWTIRCFKFIDIEGHPRAWIQGSGMKARAWQRLLDILESRNMLLCKAQDVLMATIMATRFFRGERPLNSIFLLAVLLTRIITLVITPRQPFYPPGTRAPWEVGFRHQLPGVMNRIRNREAKQPMDKVFALHGLFQDFGIPVQPPDYSKSMGQVYLEFTCALIQWHESLRVLTEASAPGIPGVPTWVPDWSRRYHRVSINDVKAAGDSAASFTIVSGGYDCSGLSSHDRKDFKWTPNVTRENPGDMPKIITKGFVEDKIEFCLAPLQEDNAQQLSQPENSEEPSPSLLHNTAVMLRWLAISQQPRFSTDKSPLSISDKLFEIMHSEVWKSFDHRAQFKEIFPDWLALFNKHINSSSSTEAPDYLAVELCAQDLRADERLYGYYVERCSALAGKRIFFTTEKGRLGTGVPGVEKGDSVALLAGNGYPMVLRERRDTVGFEVVGAAYVEGIMQGETWKGDKEDVGELVLV
jgi:hypothetical protein